MDIFFDGYGEWRKTDTNHSAIGSSGHLAGVFGLSEYDERIYRHTGRLECSGELYPSPNHPDDAFRRFPDFLERCLLHGDSDRFRDFKPEEVFFAVDASKPFQIVLAQPVKSTSLAQSKDEISQTERQSMLKLIIGMAIDAYGYNPDATKNQATGSKNGISAKLASHGISLTDDTIRKYLAEAKELL